MLTVRTEKKKKPTRQLITKTSLMIRYTYSDDPAGEPYHIMKKKIVITKMSLVLQNLRNRIHISYQREG